MIRALTARNLLHHRRLLVIGTLGMVGFEIMMVQFLALLEAGPGLRELLDMLPAAMRDFMGTQFAVASFGSGVAFGFKHPIVVAIAIALIVTVATVASGERETGFLELVLARPVPRSRYLLAVLVLIMLASVVFPVGLLAGVAVGLATVDAPDGVTWTQYVPSAVELTCLLLSIGGITLAFAAGARRRGQAVARTVGLVAALYVLDLFGSLARWLEAARWLSPFHYFHPIETALGGQTHWTHLAVLVMVFVAGTAAAFTMFDRADL